jgi:hypothetical protein
MSKLLPRQKFNRLVTVQCLVHNIKSSAFLWKQTVLVVKTGRRRAIIHIYPFIGSYSTVRHTSALGKSHHTIKILVEQALAYNTIFQKIQKMNNRHTVIYKGIYTHLLTYLLTYSMEKSPPIYAWVSQVGSCPQVSPPKPRIRLSSPQYALHAPPIPFFSILSPEQYWVGSTDH